MDQVNFFIWTWIKFLGSIGECIFPCRTGTLEFDRSHKHKHKMLEKRKRVFWKFTYIIKQT